LANGVTEGFAANERVVARGDEVPVRLHGSL
jgi:hypothetical protein